MKLIMENWNAFLQEELDVIEEKNVASIKKQFEDKFAHAATRIYSKGNKQRKRAEDCLKLGKDAIKAAKYIAKAVKKGRISGSDMKGLAKLTGLDDLELEVYDGVNLGIGWGKNGATASLSGKGLKLVADKAGINLGARKTFKTPVGKVDLAGQAGYDKDTGAFASAGVGGRFEEQREKAAMKDIMENWRAFIDEGFEKPDWEYREHPEAYYSPRNHPRPIHEEGGMDRYQQGEVIVKLMMWRGKPHKLICTGNSCQPEEISQEEYDNIKRTWKNIGPDTEM